jgi:hypothetical protein
MAGEEIWVVLYVLPVFSLFVLIFRHCISVVPIHAKLLPWLILCPLLFTWVPISVGIARHWESHVEGEPGIFISSYYGACASQFGWMWTSPSFSFATTTYIAFVLTDKSHVPRLIRAAHILVMFFIALSVSWPLYLLCSIYCEPFPDHKVSSSQRYAIAKAREGHELLISVVVFCNAIAVRCMHSHVESFLILCVALAFVHVSSIALLFFCLTPGLVLPPISTMLNSVQRQRIYVLITVICGIFHALAWFGTLRATDTSLEVAMHSIFEAMQANLWQQSVSFDLMFTSVATAAFIFHTSTFRLALPFVLAIPFASISVVFPLYLAWTDRARLAAAGVSEPSDLPHREPRPRLKICVIGAGIGGLAATYLLGGEHDVTLIEGESSFGYASSRVTLDVSCAAPRVHASTHPVRQASSADPRLPPAQGSGELQKEPGASSSLVTVDFPPRSFDPGYYPLFCLLMEVARVPVSVMNWDMAFVTSSKDNSNGNAPIHSLFQIRNFCGLILLLPLRLAWAAVSMGLRLVFFFVF